MIKLFGADATFEGARIGGVTIERGQQGDANIIRGIGPLVLESSLS
jgi:hypothetical protein